jgi:endonuclease-3 related protein
VRPEGGRNHIRDRQGAALKAAVDSNRARRFPGALLRLIYDRLYATYGPQGWWPGRTPTEVVIGAILTQNTAWRNVERAIANLRRAKALSWRALRDLTEPRLAELIRPAGTFRVKAARVKAFASFLWAHHSGSLKSLLSGDLDAVRARLLSIHGIGPETADAILLYAGNRPSFVVDRYTKRILHRHFLCEEDAGYESVRELFQSALPRDAQAYNEYHALLVAVAKKHCKTRAQCDGCPLSALPHR